MSHDQNAAIGLTQDMIATYGELNRKRINIMNLARQVDNYVQDAEALEFCGDKAAAAGARTLLRNVVVLLASLESSNERQFARKLRALAPERMAAAGLPHIVVKMLAAGVAAERAMLQRAGGRSEGVECGIDPAAAAAYAQCASAASFAGASSQFAGLIHDYGYLVRKGAVKQAERLARQVALGLVGPASRSPTTHQEAWLKIALIDSCEGGTPLLRAMIGASAAADRKLWGLGDLKTVLNNPGVDFPGEEARCRAYEAAPDPTHATPFIDRAEAIWRDLDALGGGDSDVSAGCFYALLDIGLHAAAIPARDRPEAERKIEFIADLFHFFGGPTYPGIMLGAALEFECAAWGVPLVDTSERAPRVRH